MPNTNYLIASPRDRHPPPTTSPRCGMSSSTPMSPHCDLDRGLRHVVSWAPGTFFFFLDRFYFSILMSINDLKWFKFSQTYVWTWQGQQGRGKGSRCVATCLICLSSFYVLFTILTSIWISYAYKWTQQGRGKGSRPHLIMQQGWFFSVRPF